VTSGRSPEFRILGSLEVLIDGTPAALGGAKQRAVLAALLLNANEVVSVERLVDEVWGDRSPPSAAHSLEAYVSRIRQLLNGHGPTLLRRGAGYRLDLGNAVLDAAVFVDRLEEAADAAEAGEPERAAAFATEALSLWHGPALADVALASAGRSEAERLEELRLRAYEVRLDAELGLGRHRAIVGELQSLVGQSPYRERFVGQLMLALYRSGRQGDALDVYEQTRRRLDADLGLQPSPELQQLSGQIVRQEPHLQSPAPQRPDAAPGRGRLGRVTTLTAGALAAAAVMALTASGGDSVNSPSRVGAPFHEGARVALVLPAKNRYPKLVPWNARPFRESAATWKFDAEVVADEGPALASRIEHGRFDLVLVAGYAATNVLSAAVRKQPETRFVFLDASLADLGLEGVRNASAIRFASEQTSHLAGYLSALVPRRNGRAKERVDMVSVVAGPASAQASRVVAGFETGVRRARRDVRVRVDYVSRADLATCERVANRQIDAGSDVVFVDAGYCGLGALAVARLRGVWGIGAYQDGVDPGPHVLAVFYKDYERATSIALDHFAIDDLPAGEDRVLGLNDDYAVGVDAGNFNSAVPESVWSRVVRLCSTIRSHTRNDA
jgi:DNA-binding SARP family transcriptional activator/basic membrane lipoprotein Med (substrate-binding protein (PBP1-ABC) superfamily)